MEIANAFSRPLIEENQQIASRFADVTGELDSARRFISANEAETWVGQTARPALAGADRQPERDEARYNATSQPAPIAIVPDNVSNKLISSDLVAVMKNVLTPAESTAEATLMADQYPSLGTLPVQWAAPFIAVSATKRPALPGWKRLIDVAVSFVVLLLLSPMLLLVAACIVLDSRGPVLYKSKRAGTNFYVFDMYKFRTMTARADQLIESLASHNIYAKAEVTGDEINQSQRVCADCRLSGLVCQRPLFDQHEPICERLYLTEHDEAATFMKFRNDPRITRLGAFLRNSSIDELPQLVNVLLGDMSLVGNRPLPLYEAEKLTTDESAKRFSGPAGLTGLWQVKKRAKGQTRMSDRERIALDIDYADKVSFRLDMQIIWQTIFSLWQQENV